MVKDMRFGKRTLSWRRVSIVLLLMCATMIVSVGNVYADDRYIQTPAGPLYLGPKYKMTYTGPPVTIRYSNYYSDSNLVAKNALMPVVKFIEKESGGKIILKQYWGGTLHGQKDGFKAIRGNVTDITNAYPIYQSTSFQLINAGELPFAFETPYLSAFIMEQLYPKYLKPEYEKLGVGLAWWSAIGGYGIISKRPIRSLEDLKGLKIRTEGGYSTEIFKLLGATPMFMPAQDMYNSFAKGVFDAITFDQGLIVPWKLYEVGKYFTVVNINRVSIPYALNRKTFNSLPPALKVDLYNLFRRGGVIMGAGYHNQINISVDAMKKHGVEVIYLSQEEKAKWVKAVQPLWDEFIKRYAAQGRPAKEFVADLNKLQKKYKGWTAKQVIDYVAEHPVKGIIDGM